MNLTEKISEIVVITALSEADLEDSIIKCLLDSEMEGRFCLGSRLLSTSAVTNWLSQFSSASQRFILIHDSSAFSAESEHLIRDIEIQTLSLLNIDSLKSREISEIKRAIHLVTRQSNLDSPESHQKKIPDRAIGISGTTGSPGTTLVAGNLAFELSRSRAILLADLNPRKKDLAFLYGAKRWDEEILISNNLTIVSSLEASEIKSDLIIDLGVAPELTHAVTDRRKAARDFMQVVESNARIIFVSQPEINELHEVERFLNGLGAIGARNEVIFVLNKVNKSARARSIEKRFTSRLGKYERIYLPLDLSIVDRCKAQYCPIAELAPQSRIRKGVLDLASLL